MYFRKSSSDTKKKIRSTPQNGRNKAKVHSRKKELLKWKVPQTVQDTIPYLYVYQNGIMELTPGVFSKAYILGDTNFKISSRQGQEKIFQDYSRMLSTFGDTVKVEITIWNKNMDLAEFQKQVLMPMMNDTLNEYREEYNQMLIEKMSGANNNLEKVKVMTLTIEEESIQEAITTFLRLDTEAIKMITSLTGENTKAMTSMERLCMLYDIYNPGSAQKFLQKIQYQGEWQDSVTLQSIHQLGLTTKDVIGPDSFTFKADKVLLGTKTFARTYYVSMIPTWLRGDAFTDLSELPCNMLVSVHYRTLPQDIGSKLIKSYRVNINSNVADAEKSASRAGYSMDLISQELLDSRTEVKNLTNDITKRNQKIVMASIVLTVFTSSEKELEKMDKQISMIANKHQMQIRVLSLQQEYGLATALPVGMNKIAVERLMTTETAAMLIPFSVKELNHEHGMYYGLNAESYGMIRYDRTKGQNYNGVILGMPGSGKSFATKREIINVILNTTDEVYIIDPEREYLPLAEKLGGEVIRIANGSDIYLNPFDMDIEYADDGDPVKMKADYITTIVDIAIGGRYGISPSERSLIDRVVFEIYEPYLRHLHKTGKTIDLEHMPTMQEFYEKMLEQVAPEAQNIALAMERYVKGSHDIFAHKTNVNTDNRFVIYDIKDIGSGLKELGLQICLNSIWNKMIENRKKGKRTWLYIDEFYLLLKKDTSADFLQEIWKRARKWNGIPTGITQNVEDLLKSEAGRTILNNCGFVMLLNQAPMNLIQLSNIYNISPEEQKYINNGPSGQGLIWMTGGQGSESGGTVIPFIDQFPQDTKLYKMMTTKPSDDHIRNNQKSSTAYHHIDGNEREYHK